MSFRGYSLLEAFDNYIPSSNEAVDAKDGLRMKIDNTYSRSLVERSDQRGDIAYGIRHTPGANVKVFNASKHPDNSLALSFTNGSATSFDDIIKIVKKPTGGYELHLQKINTLVIDGKRIETTSISKFL